ncbi:MAG: four helix bundle protein [Bacteroidales bacterium]|nr:four helix bundle protein [Bacteroidales bacterium]
MKTHRDLDVYKGTVALVIEIYQKTSDFPKSEIFGLTSQIRRAGVSIAANISEGVARGSSRDYIRFLRISFGSLSELETLVIIAAQIGYLSQDNTKKILEQIKIITLQISNLIKAIQKRIDLQKS